MKETIGTNGSGDCSKKNYYRYSSFLWMIIISATLSATATVIAFFPARAKAQPAQTTQNYAPARFALELAEINVTMQQPYGDNTQKMLFKINTTTGEVWALQMSTIGKTSPQILSAGWVKVVNSLQMPNITQQF